MRSTPTNLIALYLTFKSALLGHVVIFAFDSPDIQTPQARQSRELRGQGCRAVRADEITAGEKTGREWAARKAWYGDHKLCGDCLYALLAL
jgi:hypothetical protein